jgi:hypothetical protein
MERQLFALEATSTISLKTQVEGRWEKAKSTGKGSLVALIEGRPRLVGRKEGRQDTGLNYPPFYSFEAQPLLFLSWFTLSTFSPIEVSLVMESLPSIE